MTVTVNALRQLELVASLAERLLREGEPLGNELARILSARVVQEPANVEQRAMLELGLWSRRYGNELGAERIGALVLAELVSLWLDQGKTREQFVGAMSQGWRAIEEAREALSLDSCLDSRDAEPSRTH